MPNRPTSKPRPRPQNDGNRGNQNTTPNKAVKSNPTPKKD